jgi:hypothetical protein
MVFENAIDEVIGIHTQYLRTLSDKQYILVGCTSYEQVSNHLDIPAAAIDYQCLFGLKMISFNLKYIISF